MTTPRKKKNCRCSKPWRNCNERRVGGCADGAKNNRHDFAGTAFCFCCWRCCCLQAFTSVGAISAACVYSCVTARCTLPCTRAKRMKRKKRQNRRQKQSRGTRPKPSRLPPHRPSQPRRLQKRICPHNLQWKSRRNPRKQSPQKHRKHPRSRNRQYQNQKPNLPRPANREPLLPMPRQRKHLPRNHSRKKIPALWTASKRQSGRTLLAMCGTCSACCAPVWDRCCAASALAS